MSIAEKFEVIADAVYDKGVSDRDELIYNLITDNGTRIHYHQGFQYSNWSGYKFIRTIKPTGYVGNMFYNCNNMTTLPTPLDFSETFTADGYTNDTTSYRTSVFAYCRNLEFIPDLNMRALGGLEQWFRQCRKLHTVELLRVKRETIYTNTFAECISLTKIAFDGEIGNSINFKDCPLYVGSMENIIEHLVNYSGTEMAGVNTLTFNEDCWTELEDLGNAPPYAEGFSGGWRDYVNFLGWNT